MLKGHLSLLAFAFYSTQSLAVTTAPAPALATPAAKPVATPPKAPHLIEIQNKCSYPIQIGYSGPGIAWQLDPKTIPVNGSITLDSPIDLIDKDRPGLVFSAFSNCKKGDLRVDSCQIGNANYGTLFEISWFKDPSKQGVYDISAVNGFNFPISVAPVKSTKDAKTTNCIPIDSQGLDVNDCPAPEDLSLGLGKDAMLDKKACVFKNAINDKATKVSGQVFLTDAKGAKTLIGCQSPRTVSYLLQPRTSTSRGGYPLYTCDYDDPNFTVPSCYKAKKPAQGKRTADQYMKDLQHDWCAESGVATSSSYVKWIRTKNPYVYSYPSDDFDLGDGRHVGYGCSSDTKKYVVTIGPSCPGTGGSITPPPVNPPVTPPVVPPVTPPVKPPVIPPVPPVTPPASKGGNVTNIPGATWSSDADGMSVCASKTQTAGRPVGSGSILHYTFTKYATDTSYDTPGQQNVVLVDQANATNTMCYKIPKSALRSHSAVYVFFTLLPDPALNTKWATIAVPLDFQK